jgi:hypothetical protein
MLYINKKKVNLTENHQQAPTVNASDPSAKNQKKGTSQKKIESNRRNSLHSTGPRNTQRTRHNAIRHGLLAEGLTEWDDPAEYQEIIHALMAIYPSTDPVDTFLIEQMALEMLRSRRTARLEAGTITVFSRPDTSSDPTSDRCPLMIDPMMMKEYAGPALDRLQRYASAILNRLLRCRRELEPIRRNEAGGPGSTDTDIANADTVII